MREAQSRRRKGKGVKHTDQARQRMKLAAQRPRSALQLQQAKALGASNKGRIASEETRAKMRASQANRPPITEEQRKHLIEAIKHRAPKTTPDSAETNAKRTISNRKASETWPTTICPHCSKSGRGPTMKRYHFDNCKRLL